MVNLQYLNEGTIIQVRQAFRANKDLPSITLQKFFSDIGYQKLSKAVSKSAFRKNVDKMHYSYGVAKLPNELKATLNDPTVKKYLSVLLDKDIKKIGGTLCEFGWKDYTLLHDEKVEKQGIDIIIDFTEEWDENAGGKIVYVDGTWDSRNIPSSPNTLSLTIRKEGVSKFIQYCNHYARKNKRVLFLGSIL
jgi:hypothetical protein